MNFDQTDDSLQLTTRKETRQKVTQDKAGIFCRQCKARITDQSARIERQGRHYHVFTNPEQVTFEIGLFSKADCVAVSPATLEHTWFTGHAWQVVICSSCQSHLGWCFSQPDSPVFYGLIMNRLLEQDE